MSDELKKESLLFLDEVLQGTGGRLFGGKTFSKKFCFTDVQTDSRNVKPLCLFVPLIGENQNGHDYIPQAVKNGASAVFVMENEYNQKKDFYDRFFSENAETCFILVNDNLHALQDAARVYAEKKCKNMIRISITGSSGKTTTKEMMVAVCKKHFGEDFVYGTVGNFNSETGLPLSVFKVTGREKVCILEMGMNRENEIGEISSVFKSNYGIITNIGTAHIGILGSRENIAKEKRKSLDYIPKEGAAFVNEADSYADFCVQNVKGKIVKFGKNVPSKISGVTFLEDKGLFGTEFLLDGLKVCLSLSGEYNFYNALAVIACAKELGIPPQEIKEGLESLSSIPGRMEVRRMSLKNRTNVIILKDCYNANLDSMEKVLRFCKELKDIGKKIFILADMKELGDESEKSHRKIGQILHEVSPDEVFLVGEEMKSASEKYPLGHYFKNSSDESLFEIAEKIIKTVSENDLILLKGSHSMHLERLIPLLCGEGEK